MVIRALIDAVKSEEGNVQEMSGLQHRKDAVSVLAVHTGEIYPLLVCQAFWHKLSENRKSTQ